MLVKVQGWRGFGMNHAFVRTACNFGEKQPPGNFTMVAAGDM